MIKQLGWLALVFLPFSVLAEPGEDGPSDECLRSLRDVYQFYYYEIQPNPKNEGCKANDKLSSTDTLKMQVVIGELKRNCSPTVIARVNETLKGEAPAPETATG